MLELLRAYVNLLMIKRQQGQGMVEYALIIFLVSVVSIAILTTLGGQIASVFTSANTALGGATAP